MDWTDKNVLVTGADGFIGSHLADALVRAKANVSALVLYNSFDSQGWIDDLEASVRREIRTVRGDIRDAAQMRELCHGQDVIFHLAALISIPYSYEAPASYIDTNIHGTANILQGAREAGAARVVHTSTSEVYGTAQFVPITEDHPLQGQSPYSASKIAADAMVEAYARSFDLPAVTLRPFNTFGPRQSERAVISAIIRQALDPQCDSIRLGSLSPTRAFNFVDDTVAAFLAAADIGPEGYGQAFNAGTGDMITIGDLAQRILSVAQCDKSITTEETRIRPENSEVMTLVADSQKLRAATGWAPAVTLDDGLERTVEWWRNRMDRVRPDDDYIV